jgi:Na+/H+ antiporter NhaC
VQWSLSPVLVPVLTFLLAALIGFSTGTSWGTMAILYPLILPASWLLCQEQGLSADATMPLFYNVVASVLAGSVMGDHCSPISDTTIMSSLASSCNHIQHVRTQMPYALTVGVVAMLVGVLPSALGLPSWLAFLLAFGVLGLVVRLVGKKA